MFSISRHIEGISLNGIEHVLDGNGDLMEFKTPGEAIDFLVENGADEEEIGYDYFIGTKDKHDMFTYGTPEYDMVRK